MRNGNRSKEQSQGLWPWMVISLLVLAAGLIRLRLLSMPLERDEGEYAYIGQLMLHGVAPYKMAYTMKLPGTAAAYALFMLLFGQTPSGIHFGFLLMNAATIVLVYLLGRKLLGVYGGLISCAVYSLMSLSYSVLGLAAHATHFVVFFALLGLLAFLHAVETGKRPAYFCSGLLFGLSFLMKQPGMFFLIPPVFLIVWFEYRNFQELLASRALGFKRPRFDWRRCLERISILLGGFLLPFLVLCLIVFCAGSFERFWFWTFSYASSYGSRMSGPEGFQNLLQHFREKTGADVVLWLLAGVGMVLMLFDKKSGDRKIILLALLAASLLATCPGLYFRQHYFVLPLPAIALLNGYAATFLLGLIERAKMPSFARAMPAAVFALLFVLIILESHQDKILFKDSPMAACQDLFGAKTSFPESPEIARFVQQSTSAGDNIAVIGSEPQLFFYSGRRSVTGYIYTYGLMEPDAPAERMKQELIDEVTKGRPSMLVVSKLPLSWLATKESDLSIFAWQDKYCSEHYDLVGVVHFPESGASSFHWGADAAKYVDDNDDCVLVFKRKSS